jgi:hypothetical protein
MKKRLFLFVLAVTATACPVNRIAQKSIGGMPRDERPVMQQLAPGAVATITKLRGPESVLHDPQQDVYFISNLNGGLLVVDNNGFISRVNAKDMKVDLEWIKAGKNGVRLDAPKGMAIVGDTLYVSDIGTVRMFDRRTGMPKGDIALPGTTLVNDLATDGRSVWVTDTGLAAGPGETFLETGTDAIWKIDGTHAAKIASGAALAHPNGIDLVDGVLRVASFGRPEIYELADGKVRNRVELPSAQIDGLVHLDDGTMIASTWEGDAILRESQDGRFTSILAGIDSPADLGYDRARHRLLVPISPLNQVTVHVVR